MMEEQNLDSTNECNSSWKVIITNFLADKYEADFIKYLKELFKSITIDYEKESFFDFDEKQTFLQQYFECIEGQDDRENTD